MYGRGSHDRLTDSGDWRERIVLTEHRYMREDLRLGLSFLVSVAELAGVATPLAKAFLAIGGAICGEDFMQGGRTLASLGLGDLDRERIADLVARRLCANDGRTPTIACLGAGRMGRGIAVAFAYAGHAVTMIDVKARSTDQFATLEAEALGEVRKTLASLARFGLLAERTPTRSSPGSRWCPRKTWLPRSPAPAWCSKACLKWSISSARCWRRPQRCVGPDIDHRLDDVDDSGRRSLRRGRSSASAFSTCTGSIPPI